MPDYQAAILKEYLEERWTEWVEWLQRRGHEDSATLAGQIADNLSEEK